jgi:pyruvate/2-oxoglutarate/acetoin dehydrogenase E1 component/TPP-dependent pyruvate/acetoin dehydrogenase alpha subunit
MNQNQVLDQDLLRSISHENANHEEVLGDFWICCVSREASILARKDVLTGRGKFGILGDGKEVPQVAMARAFKNGDFRSGYYRDQTFMFALGLCSVEEYFSQLYADAENDPFSGGRQMNNHFATPLIDKEGNWTRHTDLKNITSCISSTGGQMARGLGVAFASKKFRENPMMDPQSNFSNNGNEVSFCTIGDASTSEGVFWEAMNAASVMRVPLAVFVWDDGYGISVPKEYQTTKGSISEALDGFKYVEGKGGMNIYKVKGWDYQSMVTLFTNKVEEMRKTHIPAMFHVEDLTQPQGHSTSGSHERYKSKERLHWESEFDCNNVMAEWMVDNNIATQEEIEDIKNRAAQFVKEKRNIAWANYKNPIKADKEYLASILEEINVDIPQVQKLITKFGSMREPLLYELTKLVRKILFYLTPIDVPAKAELSTWIEKTYDLAQDRYHNYLYSHSSKSALKAPVIHPTYSDSSAKLTGFKVLNTFFDMVLERNPKVLAFGEDVGKIGDVNQGFAGMQDKYGKERVFDTGIREWTIIGQAIGLAMRGLRPITEIQYLDYLIYGISPLSDDLSTLRYRSDNIQQAPAIIRTRGHRLEGIWHAGSPMGLLLNSLKGMYICTPRNMVQAVGMYNTLLQSDDPALVIECLNGYRLKETMPDNIGEYTVPLGSPEVLKEGADVTIVTYGSCVRIAQAALPLLNDMGIDAELIDVQTLMPFDLEKTIAHSLQKTNRLVIIDEDFAGGATGYIMQNILERDGAYQYLDSKPMTLTASDHRTPFGSDGDYFSKPNTEDIAEQVYRLMHEVSPDSFPIV